MTSHCFLQFSLNRRCNTISQFVEIARLSANVVFKTLSNPIISFPND